jgi:hypothetical protein
MMSLAAKKDIYSTFSNSEEWHKVVYDFSVDGGATSDYDVFEAKEDLIVTDFYYSVEAACTSAGSAVVDLGVGDGGVDFLSNVTVATLNTVGHASGADTAGIVQVESGEKVVMGLETATLTAGKIAFNFKVKKQ